MAQVKTKMNKLLWVIVLIIGKKPFEILMPRKCRTKEMCDWFCKRISLIKNNGWSSSLPKQVLLFNHSLKYWQTMILITN